MLNVVDLENYSRIGDWMDCQHPVIAMSMLSAGEVSVCGPRNNDLYYVIYLFNVNKSI